MKGGAWKRLTFHKGLLDQARRKVTPELGGNIRFRLADAEKPDFAPEPFA